MEGEFISSDLPDVHCGDYQLTNGVMLQTGGAAWEPEVLAFAREASCDRVRHVR